MTTNSFKLNAKYKTRQEINYVCKCTFKTLQQNLHSQCSKVGYVVNDMEHGGWSKQSERLAQEHLGWGIFHHLYEIVTHEIPPWLWLLAFQSQLNWLLFHNNSFVRHTECMPCSRSLILPCGAAQRSCHKLHIAYSLVRIYLHLSGISSE